jgi:hypothetical protein
VACGAKGEGACITLVRDIGDIVIGFVARENGMCRTMTGGALETAVTSRKPVKRESFRRRVGIGGEQVIDRLPHLSIGLER